MNDLIQTQVINYSVQSIAMLCLFFGDSKGKIRVMDDLCDFAFHEEDVQI